MRYNDKELQALSRQPAEMAAELGMRGPKKGSGESLKGFRPILYILGEAAPITGPQTLHAAPAASSVQVGRV